MNNKVILIKANKAISEGDYDTFINLLTDDVIWNLVGEQVLYGKFRYSII
ncbi:nuclear transport factor 2-like protein [Epilithonimonas lactis]|nr:hypothetical protein [Epilithonimonas lactis]